MTSEAWHADMSAAQREVGIADNSDTSGETGPSVYRPLSTARPRLSGSLTGSAEAPPGRNRPRPRPLQTVQKLQPGLARGLPESPVLARALGSALLGPQQAPPAQQAGNYPCRGRVQLPSGQRRRAVARLRLAGTFPDSAEFLLGLSQPRPRPPQTVQKPPG